MSETGTRLRDVYITGVGAHLPGPPVGPERMEDHIGRVHGRPSVVGRRALRWNANVVILDEPTAALGVRETEQVLELVRSLKGSGKTVILISHAMKDVAAVADRVTILRTGENQITLEGGSLTADNLSHYILSGEVNRIH